MRSGFIDEKFAAMIPSFDFIHRRKLQAHQYSELSMVYAQDKNPGSTFFRLIKRNLFHLPSEVGSSAEHCVP